MVEPVGLAVGRHSGGALVPGRPPLILIHGAGGTRLFWPPDVRRLEAATVYALDLPGHGESPGPGRSTIEDYAGVVVNWMGAEGIAQAVLVGHSMGGAVALIIALLHPERVAGLVLVASGGRLRVHPAIREQSVDLEGLRRTIDLVVEWSFGPSADPRLVELAGRRMVESGGQSLHGDFLACDRFDALDRLGEIRTPTLVVCGSEDRLTPPKYARALAESIPQARLEMVNGAGHMVMLEQPAAVARALAEFLREAFPGN
jgi:pimeloyl-ACP methyl ester carboxylesterase